MANTFLPTKLLFFNYNFIYLHKFIIHNVRCRIKKMTKTNLGSYNPLVRTWSIIMEVNGSIFNTCNLCSCLEG
jgi:hypothetical protein